MKVFKNLALFCVLLICNVYLFGQKTYVYDGRVVSFERGVELFNSGVYDAAQKIFDDYILQYGDGVNSPSFADAVYYSALCAAKSGEADAPKRLDNFIMNFPADLRIDNALFYLGNYYFDIKRNGYKKALDCYLKVDPADLSFNDRNEYWFKLGMCYYLSEDFDKAQPVFSKLINANNMYKLDALYYYSFIAYKNGNYSVALDGFERLVDDEKYGKDMEYVIAQIYYERRDYEKLMLLVDKLLKTDNLKLNTELARMAADVSFKKGEYDRVVEFMKLYLESVRKIDRYDDWMLGYSNYKLGNYDVALDNFQKVVSSRDSLAQDAQYHIGICYLKSGNKLFAQKAFYNAYTLAYDRVSKENALFNYAKLSYELSSDPYKTAVNALNEYLETYPDGERSDEAREYLMNLCMLTKNYSEAVNILGNIKYKSIDVMKIEQRLLYYYGIELFNRKKFNLAVTMFGKAGDMTFYPDVAAEAIYWKGESLYMLKKYDEAAVVFNDYIKIEVAMHMPEYFKAEYNLGYCYFKRKQYGKAAVNFKNFVNGKSGKTDSGLYYDGMLRLADCLLATKFYSEAAGYYNKVYKANVPDSDYALYQEAMCYGAMGKFESKASLLGSFIGQYNKSVYCPDAYYELAMSDLILNRNNEALKNFNSVVSLFPNSKYSSKALLKRGFIYYNDGKNDKALAEFKSVVEKYTGTQEANDALSAISNIYVDLNDVEKYAEYLKSVPNVSFAAKDRDSLIYLSAEKRYLAGDCEGAKKGLEEYLSRNGAGRYSVNASFYLGDCAFSSYDYDKALERFEFVINSPKNIFTENSYLKAADVSYFKGDYGKALKYYGKLVEMASNKSNVLQAQVGLMRSAYKNEDYKTAGDFARMVMSNDKVSEDLLVDAHFIIGKSAFILGDTKFAMNEFNIVKKLAKNEKAAESQYYLAFIDFNKKDFLKAEKETFGLINDFADYEYWRVKGFLLLSDIYIANGNKFQAQQTLQSVADNCDIEELKSEAVSKLSNLK